MPSVLKILHTSDWHLGRSLCEKKRYSEYESFLSWLESTINRERVDLLLVAGDIFDTSTPSNKAQELYYRFLQRVGTTTCRHVVIAAGNHDSPSFLNAPRALLKAFDIHVVGAMTENPDNEVLVLRTKAGTPEAIVCAVPYLRDRDIRLAEAGESAEDRNRKLTDGIRRHYTDVCTIAQTRRQEFGAQIPIIAMGHLFTEGGQTTDDDGVRELYVGSLVHVPIDIFPSTIDYLALGHLHRSQKVKGRENIRYCGSEERRVGKECRSRWSPYH